VRAKVAILVLARLQSVTGSMCFSSFSPSLCVSSPFNSLSLLPLATPEQAQKEIRGSKFRTIWGRVTRPHGSRYEAVSFWLWMAPSPPKAF